MFIIIKVKIIPKSSQNCIFDVENGTLKIKCTLTPEKGKVNKQIIVMIAEYYNVSKSSVTIIKGLTSPIKSVRIEK